MAQAAWVADGAASVEVAAECISCQKSRPRGRWRARWQCQFGTYWPRGTADISRMRIINWADGGGEKCTGWCDESYVRGRGGCVRGRGRAACVDLAGITLTEGGRTRWGIPNNSRSVRLFSFNVVKEDIICQKISVIDLVYNHTITLECELKIVSRMPSTKRPAVVFARATDTISKQIPLDATWFPKWNWWILKENRRHVMLFYKAVGQRSQLIPEVLDTINETWTKTRGEEFVSSLSNDKDRVEPDEQFQFDSTDMQVVPIWTGKVYWRTGRCQKYWPCSWNRQGTLKRMSTLPTLIWEIVSRPHKLRRGKC